MKTSKNYAFPFVLITLFILVFVGCGESNTVASFIVSERQYAERSSLESAKQPEQLTAGKTIYASVYFIESPKGMEYTAKWFIDGNEVKTDKQKMPTDRKGIIIFSLEEDKVTACTLKFQISYNSYILASKELIITGK